MEPVGEANSYEIRKYGPTTSLVLNKHNISFRIPQAQPKAIRFEIVVQNVSRLRKKVSKEYQVQGENWEIEIKNMKESNSLGIYLFSTIKDEEDNWVIIARATFKLVSDKLHVKSFEKYLPPQPFTPTIAGWGMPMYISMETLLDEKAGFITENTCKFDIEIESAPRQEFEKHNWLNMRTAQMGDSCSHAIFELEIIIHDNFIGICSPIFVLHDLRWQLLIRRNSSPNLYDFFEICLINLTQEVLNWECQLEAILTFVSFNENCQSARKHLQNVNFGSTSVMTTLHMSPWESFVDLQQKLLNNKLFVCQVEIKICEEICEMQHQTEDIDLQCVPLECTICAEHMDERPISLTGCDHIFCNECSDKIIKGIVFCQVCEKGTLFNELDEVEPACEEHIC